MNWSTLLPSIIAAVVAIAAWFAGHALAAKRDRENKIRDLRIGYLIDAYRKIECCAGHDNPFKEKEYRDRFDSAAADIQLFGSARQVELVQNFAQQLSETHNASVGDLLEELRVDLRKTLKLQKVPKRIFHIRTKPINCTDTDRANHSNNR